MASSTKPKREEEEKTGKYKKKEREKMESFENKNFRGKRVFKKTPHLGLRSF
jgi:hypothetical protein